MGRSRKSNAPSPAQTVAKGVKRKYKRGNQLSPGKRDGVRRALYEIKGKKVSIRKAATQYGLSYGFLHRRLSGAVDIDKGMGRDPIFSAAEEEAMAVWLSEMAERGLGLRPCEFLDFVKEIVIKEKRKTPFTDCRPGFGWYVAFKNRNSHIITTKPETALELNRAKVTKDVTDRWYSDFRTFLISKQLLNKPSRIWNADESGFNMGSNKSKVIGPARSTKSHVPHVTAGKQRLTVMFCGSASGQMMPPFFVYPEPRPRGYNPLTGAQEGSEIRYTKKGWMDAATFSLFIDHFDKFAGAERPVLLLIDSVSSHVDCSVFQKAKEKGIELYRLVPNATHLMQPLDKGVFGPLKAKWHLVARKHVRDNPGKNIGKEIFPEKLKEAFLLFYKPLTVINAFKSSGIYPVDGTVISSDTLKPGLTYSTPKAMESEQQSSEQQSSEQQSTEQQSSEKQSSQPTVSAQEVPETNKKATCALEVFQEVLSTPVRTKYQMRIEEGYDIDGESPCFDVYRKLHDRAKAEKCDKVISKEIHVDDIMNVEQNEIEKSSEVHGVMASEDHDTSKESSLNMSGLDALLEAARMIENAPTISTETLCSPLSPENSSSSSAASTGVSPVITEALVLPQVPDDIIKTNKSKAKKEKLPDNLTSPECIRTMSLRQLSKVKAFAEKEKRAKQAYLKKAVAKSKCAKTTQSRKKQMSNERRGKAPTAKKTQKQTKKPSSSANTDDIRNRFCKGCLMTWLEDTELGLGGDWVQCEKCKGWLHAGCLTESVFQGETFSCPSCK